MELETLKNWSFVLSGVIFFSCFMYFISLATAFATVITIETQMALYEIITDFTISPISLITVLVLDIILIAAFTLIALSFLLIRFMEIEKGQLTLRMVRFGMFFLFFSFVHLNYLVMMQGTYIGVGLSQFSFLSLLYDPSRTPASAGFLFIAEMIWAFIIVFAAVISTGIALNEIINDKVTKES